MEFGGVRIDRIRNTSRRLALALDAFVNPGATVETTAFSCVCFAPRWLLSSQCVAGTRSRAADS